MSRDLKKADPNISLSLRRARALLGTLVEISVFSETDLLAVPAAFSAIEHIHALMSFHADNSDVARLNRAVPGEPVRVGADTVVVLRAALELSVLSLGAFDVCVAPTLQAYGFLPGEGGAVAGDYRALEILDATTVRKAAPVRVDLGGIAKGYAVDCAVTALAAAGVRDYVVNAGGDLRVGRLPQPVHLRHPGQPGQLLALPALADTALATSASYFSRVWQGGEWRHPIVVPASGRCTDAGLSVSVLHGRCMLADALTKVVAVRGPEAAPVLRALGARALCINTESAVWELPA